MTDFAWLTTDRQQHLREDQQYVRPEPTPDTTSVPSHTQRNASRKD
jgi:hypothetical protein